MSAPTNGSSCSSMADALRAGPDRSDVEHWSYATYETAPGPRDSTGSRRWPGALARTRRSRRCPWRGGFILKAEADYDRQLTTGKATWDVAKLDGFEFTPGIFFVGAQLTARDCGPPVEGGQLCQSSSSSCRAAPHPLWRKRRRDGSCFPRRCPIRWIVTWLSAARWRWAPAPLAKEDAVLAEQGAPPGIAQVASPHRRQRTNSWFRPIPSNSCSGTWAITTVPIPCAMSAAAPAPRWPGAGPNPSTNPKSESKGQPRRVSSARPSAE